MQRMQRKFGTFLPRTADNAQVATLVSEFREADKALESLIDAGKHWRDAWNDILRFQSNMTHELEVLYMPIGGDGEMQPSHIPVDTPTDQMERVSGIREAYSELKNDMLEEVKQMDEKIIKPAQDARAGIAPMKKSIKRRDDKKLDYERYQSRVDAIDKKARRTDRDNVALAKHNIDLDRSSAEYQAADDILKQCLPPVVNALLSLFPCLLEAQIEIQNALLAHCYTALHNYCQDHGLPSPAPEIEDIIATWQAAFGSVRTETEQGLRMIAAGKTILHPMDGPSGKKSYSGLNIRNGISNKRSGSQASVPQTSSVQSPAYRNGSTPSPQPPPDYSSKPRMNSYSSSNSLKPAPSNDGLIRFPSNGGSVYSQASAGAEQDDYFATSRSTGTANPYFSTPIATPGGSVLGKKKPPPPPPKKNPSQGGQYVTALYDFDGQGEGDLAFREGDRIRVVKKTGSEMDWWEGELRGVRGAFPANYCKIA